MIHRYWPALADMFRVPFENPELIWAIVPLYFGWMLNELTSSKASFRTAIQTGFSFVWAGAHWSYLYFHRSASAPRISLDALMAVNVAVTLFILAMGAVALVSGIRRRYPPGCSFLGHARFANYFMIAIFPMQSNYREWSWHRLAAIFIFAIPIWIVLHFGLRPFRK
ncbi:MAG: hypothetical protein ABIR24_06985 [Verrucomicrobiota bacterium]